MGPKAPYQSHTVDSLCLHSWIPLHQRARSLVCSCPGDRSQASLLCCFGQDYGHLAPPGGDSFSYSLGASRRPLFTQAGWETGTPSSLALYSPEYARLNPSTFPYRWKQHRPRYPNVILPLQTQKEAKNCRVPRSVYMPVPHLATPPPPVPWLRHLTFLQSC